MSEEVGSKLNIFILKLSCYMQLAQPQLLDLPVTADTVKAVRATSYSLNNYRC